MQSANKEEIQNDAVSMMEWVADNFGMPIIYGMVKKAIYRIVCSQLIRTAI